MNYFEINSELSYVILSATTGATVYGIAALTLPIEALKTEQIRWKEKLTLGFMKYK